MFAALLLALALLATGLGTSVRDSLLNWFRGTTFQAAPTTIYLAAFTVAPTAAGGGTEVTGGAYARVAFTLGAPAAGSESNGSQIVFPTATAGWGTIVAVAVMSAASAGTLHHFKDGLALVVNSGNRLVFDPAQLGLTAT